MGIELSSRTIALRSVLMAAVIFGLADVVDGAFGWSTLIAAGASLLAVVMLFRDRQLFAQGVAVRRIKPSSVGLRAPAALLAALPDPVILIDRHGVVLKINPAARTLFPLLIEARPLLFTVRAPAVLNGIDDVLRTGVPVQAEFREHGIVERVLEAHIAPLVVREGGRPEGALLLIRDLTTARRIERMRVDFIANASHELRTPLASLVGFIETLQGSARNDDNARERFLVIMRDQAKRMSRLIDDLLSLSRIELNLHVPPRGRAEVGELVHHMIEALAPLARERGVTVTLEQTHTPLLVAGDRDELLRVAENLIENAIKYGQKGQRVDVCLAAREGPEGDEVAITVRDYGPGVAPKHLPRLTERFYRGDGADSYEKEGTGLGLAIVKHIVNRHRGRFDISSKSGEGAIFTVSLPRIDSGE